MLTKFFSQEFERLLIRAFEEESLLTFIVDILLAEFFVELSV